MKMPLMTVVDHSIYGAFVVQDAVDAIIYVLKGTKRVRVAGHYPGSKVTLDKAPESVSNTHANHDEFHESI